MKINKNTVPTFLSQFTNYINMKFVSDDTHSEISNSFSEINTLYNNSSVIEDIILNKYLYVVGLAKSISKSLSSNIIYESFLSQGLFDPSFPAFKKLAIDTQNGYLVLSTKSTTDIKVDSIIVESESNGNVQNGSSISDIASANKSTAFSYVKTVNSMELNPLYLNISLGLDQEMTTNGIYIKFFTEEGGQYPTIKEIEILSVDTSGIESWKNINIETQINKADYFIRYNNYKTKNIRIKFEQKSYTSYSTNFGNRYKYLIGLREISVKQLTYEESGEYVSIPFSSKSNITSVKLNSTSTEDATFYVSANNGSKWKEIKNNESTILDNKDFGLSFDYEIDSVRLKISMDKKNSVASYLSNTEYSPITESGKYYLTYSAEKLKAYIGGHISYGDRVQYKVQLKDLADKSTFRGALFVNPKQEIVLKGIPFENNIRTKLLLKIDDMVVVNSAAIYTFAAHIDKMNTVMIIQNEDLLKGSNTLCISYIPYVHSSSLKSQIITLPAPPINRSKNSISIFSEAGQLAENDFTLNEDDTITILDKAYNPEYDYTILFTPAFDCTDKISKISGNEIDLINIPALDNGKMLFSYKYITNNIMNELIYYTPICKEYILELI